MENRGKLSANALVGKPPTKALGFVPMEDISGRNSYYID
jgi:hypothetical protein